MGISTETLCRGTWPYGIFRWGLSLEKTKMPLLGSKIIQRWSHGSLIPLILPSQYHCSPFPRHLKCGFICNLFTIKSTKHEDPTLIKNLQNTVKGTELSKNTTMDSLPSRLKRILESLLPWKLRPNPRFIEFKKSLTLVTSSRISSLNLKQLDPL